MVEGINSAFDRAFGESLRPALPTQSRMVLQYQRICNQPRIRSLCLLPAKSERPFFEKRLQFIPRFEYAFVRLTSMASLVS